MAAIRVRGRAACCGMGDELAGWHCQSDSMSHACVGMSSVSGREEISSEDRHDRASVGHATAIFISAGEKRERFAVERERALSEVDMVGVAGPVPLLGIFYRPTSYRVGVNVINL